MKRTPLKRKTPLKQGVWNKKKKEASQQSESAWPTRSPLKTRTPLKQGGRLKSGKPLKKRSKRREVQEKEYSRLRRQFLTENPVCVVCGEMATDCHHRFGRGNFYLDVSTWAALCRKCHDRVHANVLWAKEMKLLVYGKDAK